MSDPAASSSAAEAARAPSREPDPPLHAFSEREFYLAEFRRRSIGIVWPEDMPAEPEPLAAVVDALVTNESRVVLLGATDAVLAQVGPEPPVDGLEPDFAPRLWRQLQQTGRAALRIASPRFALDCQRTALTLRLAKVVWIQSEPPVQRVAGGGRVSVVDLRHLEALLRGGGGVPADPSMTAGLQVGSGQRPLLEAIRGMIEGGIPAVNVCAAADLGRELFTYAGAGMFFTRDRYAEVRPLALDDYDPASDLIRRGEADGFLAPRDRASRDAVLAHGVGVFIEGRYLAGIGAILPHASENAAEIASLFALTRYVGEGVGSQIVRFAIERSRREGLAYLFSCTTSSRVEGFFERHGFRQVDQSEVPKAKWEGYDPERRARVRCLRFDP